MNCFDLWPVIQRDLYGVLAADAQLGTRPGVLLEPGDLASGFQNRVSSALSLGSDGRLGVGFLVLPIERAADENPGLPGGPLKLTLTVQWVENVTLNRGPRGTGLPLRVWVARAARALKLYTPVLLTQPLLPQNPLVHEFTPDHDDQLRIGQLDFTATEADSVPYNKLARPQLTATGALPNIVVTVTPPPNLDAAGLMYYTLDGSHPYARNPQAQLYTGPVTVNQPGLFRVRAYPGQPVAPCEPSDTAALLLGNPF